MLSTWMLSQENPSLIVNGQRVSLSKKCPIQMNAATRDACINSIPRTDVTSIDRSVDSTSPTIGSFFGGVVAGISILVIAYGIIFL